MQNLKCFERPHSSALLPCVAVIAIASSAAAQTALQTLVGTEALRSFGSEVANVGDVDMDGFEDYAIGAPLENSFNGRAFIYSGATLQLLRVINGTETGARLGAELVGLGDTNNDGYGDVLVTSPASSFGGTVQSVGRAEIYSGQWIATGSGAPVLVPINGLASPFQANDLFGEGAANLGNLNNDGIDDYGIGALDLGGPGYVSIRSGANSVGGIAVLFGDNINDRFGSALASIGDAIGDGRDDFVVGAPQTSTGPGYVRGFNANTAAAYTVFGTSVGDRFGNAVAGIGDVNNDGNGDFVVGAPGSFDAVGYARVCSGVDGSTLFTVVGDGPGDLLGTSVDGCGDLNGDGTPDFMVGAPGDPLAQFAASPGYVRVYSGVNGAVLFTMQGDPSTAFNGGSDEFGGAVAAVGDANGDGFAELLVGAPRDDNGGNDAGSARLHSGAALLPTISGDKTQLSVSAGGTLTLQLQATPAFAGSFYVVLGSTSGSTPGFVQDGVLVPLNIDGYFNLTLTSANFPINGVGLVPANGLAQATVPLGPDGSPNLIGVTVSHAAVLLAQPIPFVQAATNAFRTVLAP